VPTIVNTPDGDEPCAYYGSRIFDHDSICVQDCTDAYGSPTYFGNYACFRTHVDKNGLVTGDACAWNPDDSTTC
jgi:hypothetical protein